MATSDSSLTPLKRGGMIISIAESQIQLGIPPETIKDSMQLKSGVPDTFIIPQFMFFLSAGISLAELEFPIYYNFFFKKKKIRIICSQEQHRRLTSVLQEALFGPEQLDYADEFIQGKSTPGYPDLRAELDHFRTLPMQDGLRKLKMEDVAEFILFDEEKVARVDDIEIHLDPLFNISIRRGEDIIAEIDRHTPLTPQPIQAKNHRQLFSPPLFGITALGTGHGFDPNADTSGLILWLNRRGIIIDPLVGSTQNLQELGVNPKLIDTVILTHCHADHDAGTLQKIMREGKLNLYTTKTIFNSFLRKSSALTGIEENTLREFVRFLPITIGEPMNINGGTFLFNYSFHSIPTISIQADFQGKGMVYSSDTMSDIDFINDLQAKGVLSKNRANFLRNFPWHKDVVFHEAGIAPLHTPIDFLLGLPEDVRERMYLVHVSPASIPQDSGLKIAPAGLHNTVELEVDTPYFDEAMQIISVLLNIDIFNDLSLEKVRELLSIARKEHHPSGHTIFEKDQIGDRFYIIIHGEVEISQNGQRLTLYSDSDYFGEKALFSHDDLRTATARTLNDTSLLSISSHQMQQFIRGTEIGKTLKSLASQQNQALRKTLNASPLFRKLTPTQQTHLHKIVEPIPESIKTGTVIIHEESPSIYSYFICQGYIDAIRKNVVHDTLKPGQLFGIAAALSDHDYSHFSFIVHETVTLLRISNQSLLEFVRKNPGMYIKLFYHDY